MQRVPCGVCLYPLIVYYDHYGAYQADSPKIDWWQGPSQATRHEGRAQISPNSWWWYVLTRALELNANICNSEEASPLQARYCCPP